MGSAGNRCHQREKRKKNGRSSSVGAMSKGYSAGEGPLALRAAQAQEGLVGVLAPCAFRPGAAETSKWGLAAAQASMRASSSGVKGCPLDEEGGDVAALGGDGHDVVGGLADPERRSAATAVATARSISRGGLCSRRIMCRMPSSAEAGQVELEGLAGVEVVLGEDVGGARGAAVGVDAGELDDVVAARGLGQEVPALVVDQADPRIVHPGPEVLAVVLP